MVDKFLFVMSKCAVIVGRNDNYGGNLIHRAKHCLNNLSTVFDHVIYVDWKVRQCPLTDKFDVPSNVTTISVEKETIQKYWPQYINYPVVESIGRNIGIRRAIENQYDWICSTNIDVLMNSFDCESWYKDTLFTARRRNIQMQDHLQYSDNAILLQSINKHKDKIELAPVAVVNGIGVWDPGDHWSMVVCCGDFQLAHRNLWQEIRGFEEEMAGRCYADSNLMKRPILIGKKTAIADVDVFHLNHTDHSERDEDEYLPINDQKKYITDWIKSTNTKNWGII